MYDMLSPAECLGTGTAKQKWQEVDCIQTGTCRPQCSISPTTLRSMYRMPLGAFQAMGATLRSRKYFTQRVSVPDANIQRTIITARWRSRKRAFRKIHETLPDLPGT